MKNKQDKIYTHETLQEERRYGLYWYNWLWAMVRPFLVLFASVILLCGILITAWSHFTAENIDAPNPNDQTEISFTVNSGDSLTKVANKLQSQGIIRNRTVFRYYADFMGFGQKIQAGEYQLSRSMNIGQIAEKLTQGDGRTLVRTITIIPGWSIEDIAAYLVKEKALSDSARFLELCKNGKDFSSYYYVADLLPSAAKRKYALEGYLAADTYEIYSNSVPEDIIKKLLSQTEGLYKEGYHDRASELGLSMDQVFTLASLIEKEAKTQDFARVSAVFHNRLSQKMPLGSDVTIKYALGIKRMVLTKEDLNLNSPFNSYTHKGLPPGPICCPSPASLQAALYPDEGFIKEKYLYFCSKDPNTGELQFSKTLKEHEQAVKIYGPLWQAFDQKNKSK